MFNKADVDNFAKTKSILIQEIYDQLKLRPESDCLNEIKKNASTKILYYVNKHKSALDLSNAVLLFDLKTIYSMIEMEAAKEKETLLQRIIFCFFRWRTNQQLKVALGFDAFAFNKKELDQLGAAIILFALWSAAKPCNC